MGSTYIQLTNRLLRRLNEVELTTDNFNVVRGLPATIKDCIVDSLREIHNEVPTLSQIAYEHTETLVVGTREYPWQSGFMEADWDSFEIQKDDILNVSPKRLFPINRQEWYQETKELDDAELTDGRGFPEFVFETHGYGYGVTPVPSEAYTLKYRYWKSPDDLNAHGDQTTVPQRFDYVIVDGALYHMYLFRDNETRASMAKQKFQRGLATMKNQLVERPLKLEDTRPGVGHGG